MTGAVPTLVVGMFFHFNLHAHDERGHGAQRHPPYRKT
jgi:hypothetical protein